ncbi:MAG: phenylalanine 4-monooxygenase [Gemmatimonadota bacterium]
MLTTPPPVPGIPTALPAGVDPALFTTQDFSGYSQEDHEVWGILFQRRMEELEDTGSETFLSGAEAIGLDASQLPDLREVNARLAEMTGWGSVPVVGFLEAKLFFRCLAARRFPTTVFIRRKDQLEYLPEPDIFHDVFGHVPLHANPTFADFLQTFGAVAAAAKTPDEVQAMARLFWFTVEFGLVHERGAVRVYGSGLISSAGDAANALGPACQRRPFTLDGVLNQPFEIDRLQDVLFVVDDFSQLFEACREAEHRLQKGKLLP